MMGVPGVPWWAKWLIAPLNWCDEHRFLATVIASFTLTLAIILIAAILF